MKVVMIMVMMVAVNLVMIMFFGVASAGGTH
jgi:hypothetical protein